MGEQLSGVTHWDDGMAVALRQASTAPAPRSPASVPPALARLQPTLDVALRADAPDVSSLAGTMAAYHLGWIDAAGRPAAANGGKALRGCLALWAAQSCGGNPRHALPAAAAVEWIHNFTLVHDDIQDGDVERRHRPTVWSVWGSAQAINAGDAMHAVAYRSLLGGRGPAEPRLRAARAINDAVLRVIDGQCLDLDLEGRVDTTVPTYLRLARWKTGALLGAALEAGALLGGADARQATLLRRAGLELGVAFQVRDDWLGAWGEATLTGKGCGADLARRKLSYPVVVALARLRGAARRELRRLYRTPSGGEALILALLDEAGAEQAAHEELLRSAAAVRTLGVRAGLDPVAREELSAIVDFVVERVA